MSSGYVRRNEEGNIPLKSPIWLMEVTFENGQFQEDQIHLNKTQMMEIVDRLKNADKTKRYYIIWHGQYNTDIFQVDPIKIAYRLESEYQNELQKQRAYERERQKRLEKMRNDYEK